MVSLWSVDCGISYVALSNLICPQNLCLDIASPARLITPKQRNDHWQAVNNVQQTRLKRLQSRKFTPQRRRNTKWLGNITMWNLYTDSTGGEICTQNEDKTWQRSVKDDIISHDCVCDGPTWSMQIMHIDLLGNTQPLKVDRNLQ